MGKISETDARGFYELCRTSEDTQEISDELSRLLESLGFTTWYIGSVVHESELSKGFGFSREIPEWRKRYAEARHCDNDPVFRAAFRSTTMVQWSKVRAETEARGDKRGLAVFEEAASFGMNEGLTKAWHGFAGVPIALTTAGPDPDVSMDAQMSVLRVGMSAFDGFSRIVEGYRPLPPRLTPKEFDVLRWRALGKTAWETGEIMRISKNTVRAHEKRLKLKYQAATIVQVVVRALLDGTLAPDPSTYYK
jgi:LuxR family quorum sensing-dependent transcriptional regulator